MGKMFILVKEKHHQILKHDTISSRIFLQRIFVINQFFSNFKIVQANKNAGLIRGLVEGRGYLFVIK